MVWFEGSRHFNTEVLFKLGLPERCPFSHAHAMMAGWRTRGKILTGIGSANDRLGSRTVLAPANAKIVFENETSYFRFRLG